MADSINIRDHEAEYLDLPDAFKCWSVDGTYRSAKRTVKLVDMTSIEMDADMADEVRHWCWPVGVVKLGGVRVGVTQHFDHGAAYWEVDSTVTGVLRELGVC